MQTRARERGETELGFWGGGVKWGLMELRNMFTQLKFGTLENLIIKRAVNLVSGVFSIRFLVIFWDSSFLLLKNPRVKLRKVSFFPWATFSKLTDVHIFGSRLHSSTVAASVTGNFSSWIKLWLYTPVEVWGGAKTNTFHVDCSTLVCALLCAHDLGHVCACEFRTLVERNFPGSSCCMR